MVPLDLEDSKAHQVQQDLAAHLVVLVQLAQLEAPDLQDSLEPLAARVQQVQSGHLDLMVSLELVELKVQQASLV